MIDHFTSNGQTAFLQIQGDSYISSHDYILVLNYWRFSKAVARYWQEPLLWAVKGMPQPNQSHWVNWSSNCTALLIHPFTEPRSAQPKEIEFCNSANNESVQPKTMTEC